MLYRFEKGPLPVVLETRENPALTYDLLEDRRIDDVINMFFFSFFIII